MQPARRILITSLVLFFLSQILFLVNIQFPSGHNFDEFHYVPAAKEMLAGEITRNWEHPPLGKQLMAIGIGLWGDRPIGWRYMSTIFGSFTLIGMYLWALALFRRQNIAVWVASLTLVNHLLYVQARIGMLDTFMFAFLTGGLAAFTAAWNAELELRKRKLLLAFAGILLGLATAAKWSGVVALGTCVMLVLFTRTAQLLRIRGQWAHPDPWKGIGPGTWILCLGVLPAVTYLLTFVPLLDSTKATGFFGSIFELFAMQKRMWEGQLRVVTPHPYMSQWWDWPFLTRPIWYAFDKESDTWVRGVLLLGNPLIMWSGVFAFFYCLYGWLWNGHRPAFLITAFYTAFTFCWIVIPRKVSFYYYYYPSGMVLSLALAYLFSPVHEKEHEEKLPWQSLAFLGVAGALFIYFFPILAALRIPAELFRRWMWFRGWI